MDESSSATALLAITVLVNVGLAGMVGSCASIAWLNGSGSEWAKTLLIRSHCLLRAASVLTLASTLFMLWLQAAAMAEAPLVEAWNVIPAMLEATHVGHAWLVGFIALLAVLGISALPLPAVTAWRTSFVLPGILIFAYSRSAMSHAGTQGWVQAAVWVDMAHLLLVSLWSGAVFIAGFAALAHAIGPSAVARLDALRWIRALSKTATWTLAGIVATGILNALRGLGAVEPLFRSPYGNALLVKVVLVGVAALLGGFNRFRVMPRLLLALQVAHDKVDEPRRTFLLVLRVEAPVLLAALVAAGVMSASAPPGTG
ncbi:MAG: CopD family protein [Burkholderiales bacterium]|nr:CopD family protein [Burkholderiales bacterium]